MFLQKTFFSPSCNKVARRPVEGTVSKGGARGHSFIRVLPGTGVPSRLSQMMCIREFSCGGEGFHVEAKKGIYHELYPRRGHVTSKLYLDEAYSTFRRNLRSSIMTNNSDRYSSYFTYPLLIYRYSIL